VQKRIELLVKLLESEAKSDKFIARAWKAEGSAPGESPEDRESEIGFKEGVAHGLAHASALIEEYLLD